MSAPQANEAEKNLEIWKVKKLIKRLEAARGNGTSMISLIIRMLGLRSLSSHQANRLIAPKDQVSRAAKMLAEEFVSKTPVSLGTLLTLYRAQPRTLNHVSTDSQSYQPLPRHSSDSSSITKSPRMASLYIAEK